MHPSKVLGALCSIAFLGILAFVPSGCSNEDGAFTSPGGLVPTAGYDGSPPSMPAGAWVEKATDDGFRLQWMPNQDQDLAGYRVYVYDPSPDRENSYVCLNGASLIDKTQTWYVYGDDTALGTHYFKFAAVDQAGNESVRFGPLIFTYSGSTPKSSDDVPTGPDDAHFSPPQHGFEDPGWVEGGKDPDDVYGGHGSR